MNKCTVLAPAKLNLTLDITGRRGDGYHLLSTVMQAVDLFERVEVARASHLTLRTSRADLPAGPDNTAYRAAEAFFAAAQLEGGAEIFVEKNAPIGAGMGGGSADAAGVLVALNALYETGFSLGQLQRIGLAVGADVSFALLGGTALATGIGEVLTPLRPLENIYFAVAMPENPTLSGSAFGKYDRLGPGKRPDNETALHAIEKRDLPLLAGAMANAMERAIATEEMQQVIGALQHSGALAAQMTGSGSAVFGLFDEEEKAQQAAACIADQFPVQCWALRPFAGGPYIESAE